MPRRPPLTAGRPGFRTDRKAAVALMTAVMAPALLAVLALIADAGFWIVGSTQLQVAADAAAMGAGQLLTSNLKNQSAATQQTNLNAAALFEATRAATKLVGTMNAPVVTPAADFSYVDVVVTSQAPGYLNGIIKMLPPNGAVNPPLLRATARVTVKGGPKACVLTLGTSGTDIQVGNSGTIAATSCPIFANSNGSPSIHATGSGSISESGAISGTDIGAVGTIQADNGGSISAGTITPGGAVTPDYVAAQNTAPAAGTCGGGQSDFTDNHNGQPYVIPPQTWCNVNVSFGGNGNTIQLSGGGAYTVVNGNITFNNATVTFAAGVTFNLLGTSPGNFAWTNYSNTSNPITAGSSGIAIWQACNSSGSQTATFNGGSTLNMTGIVYMPCANVTIDNNAQLNAPIGKGFSIVSKTLTVNGSAGLRTAASSSGGTASAGPVLTQ